MSKKQYARINAEGAVIGLLLFDEYVIPVEDDIVPDPPEGLHEPKWDGEQWIEGLLQSDLLAGQKQTKIDELNAVCNAFILSGFTSSALGDPHDYDFDYEAQINLAGMMNAISAGIAPATITWKTKNAGSIDHDHAQFTQLYADGLTFKNTQIGKYWILKAQVQAATTEAEIDAIVW